jgi:hypothetical protein
MFDENSSRRILARTLYAKASSEHLGFIYPLAEVIDGQLVELDASTFCPTMKVFITSHYDDIERLFPDQKLFEIDVKLSSQTSENVNPELACKYVATAQEARATRPKDYLE